MKTHVNIPCLLKFHDYLLCDFEKNLQDFVMCPAFCRIFGLVLASSITNLCIVSAVCHVDSAPWQMEYTEATCVQPALPSPDEHGECLLLTDNSGQTHTTQKLSTIMFKDLMFEAKLFASAKK